MLLLLIASNVILPFLAQAYFDRSRALMEGAIELGILAVASIAVGSVYLCARNFSNLEQHRRPGFVLKIVTIAFVPNCTSFECMRLLGHRFGPTGWFGLAIWLGLGLAMHLTMAMAFFTGRRRTIAVTAVVAEVVGVLSLFVVGFLWFALFGI